MARTEFPSQFWLMFSGMIISTIGTSMVWPFLMIYASGKLQQPLTIIAGLMTINAAMGIISSFIAGPVLDKVGRKGVMVISLILNALGNLALSQANSLLAFGLIMGFNGAMNPLFRVGADAMMADLIPPEKRADAYSLLRMANNIGVAVGPAIGGFIASRSYTVAFIIAATGMTLYSLLLAFFAHETLPDRSTASQPKDEPFGGYGRIFADRKFMPFLAAFTLTQVCSALIWVLLSVYLKNNFHISESLYGFIPTTNAVMVILFQISITQVTKRFPPLSVLALGTLFYAAAVSSIALGQGFWAFWGSMVVMTLGELMLMPTATSFAANLAPADMRGRYMGLYGLTWAVASGLGPVFGGMLNDTISPQATWLGGGLVGLVSVVGFMLLARRAAVKLEKSGA
jgi:MFS family permease